MCGLVSDLNQILKREEILSTRRKSFIYIKDKSYSIALNKKDAQSFFSGLYQCEFTLLEIKHMNSLKM